MTVYLAAGWRQFYGRAKYHRSATCPVVVRWLKGRNTRNPTHRTLLTEIVSNPKTEIPASMLCRRCWRET